MNYITEILAFYDYIESNERLEISGNHVGKKR